MNLGDLPSGTIVQWEGSGDFIILPKSYLLQEASMLSAPDRVAVISLEDLHVGWAYFNDTTYTIISN